MAKDAQTPAAHTVRHEAKQVMHWPEADIQNLTKQLSRWPSDRGHMRASGSRHGKAWSDDGTDTKYDEIATRKRLQYCFGEMTVGSLRAPPSITDDFTQVSSCLSHVYCTALLTSQHTACCAQKLMPASKASQAASLFHNKSIQTDLAVCMLKTEDMLSITYRVDLQTPPGKRHGVGA